MSSPTKATCHCGAITLTVPHKPTRINECQCTICRRYGAAWAYYKTDDVTIEAKEGSSTKAYVWGDKDHGFHHCDHCGCVMYWYPIDMSKRKEPEGGWKMGVNTRMMNPVHVRHVDREMLYDAALQPIGPKEEAHPEDLAKY